jgi:hypothetical protein
MIEETPSVQSLGGKARAESLSSEDRSQIARLAAEARWSKRVETGEMPNIPKALKSGEIRLKGLPPIPCAVLDNDARIRVITQRGMFVALGRNKNPSKGQASIDNRPAFLAAANLTPFIPEDLIRSWNPIPFRLPKGSGGYRGNIAFGYDAKILPMVCNVFEDAKEAGVLNSHQAHIAKAAKLLGRGLQILGIIALIDEATGYQEIRDRDALQRILDRYIGKELAKWAERFPKTFYEQMFRLKGWNYDPQSSKRPMQMAQITVDLVFDRIGPGLTKDLRTRRKEILEATGKTGKLHQVMTTDVGHPALSHHLAGLEFTAKSYADGDWDGFYRAVERAAPKYNRSLLLAFPEDALELST